MGMNLSTSSLQPLPTSFTSPLAPAKNLNLPVKTANAGNAGNAGNNAVVPSSVNPNTAPPTGLMDIMRLMMTVMSMVIGMIGGNASGNSPFTGALDNTQQSAVNPGNTDGTTGDYGAQASAVPPVPPGGYGAAPEVTTTPPATDTGAAQASAVPPVPTDGYGAAPEVTTTPPATDTGAAQQCPGLGNGQNSDTVSPGVIPPTPATPPGTPATPPATAETPPATPETPPVTPVTPTTPVTDDGTQPLNMFTASDYKNFLLAGSHGGTTGTAEEINSKYADPNSRFARTGNDQFQAAIAGMYANQFKGYALGADVAYSPGKDINKIANDLTQVQNVQMTPEAEMLSKVAALYRGNLTGVNLYDNPKLQGLLQSWGRTDIASQPDVGNPNGDVQSIGGVIKALNEEQDPTIRKAWLQQIFDFAGNSPSSPSGAVPNLPEYQQAISLVRGGALNNLLGGYVQTTGT